MAALTSPVDNYTYSFLLSDRDYIPPLAPLPHVNLTQLPPADAATIAAIAPALPLPDGLVTWDTGILETNLGLWEGRENQKIIDAVETLQDSADIFMRVDPPIFYVVNKTNLLPADENQPSDARLYYSLSEFYWPSRVSDINPQGFPYEFRPSRNPEVLELTPNRDQLAQTMEHITTLSLAAFFTRNAAYAQRARDKVFAWFLDPQVGMRPSLRGAALVPGVTRSGRPEGIQDLAPLPDVINSVALLRRVRTCLPSLLRNESR